MRKFALVLVALGFAASTAGVSATPWTDEGVPMKSGATPPAKCCSSEKLKADLKEIEAVVGELKSALAKSPAGNDEIRSKAVKLRTLADDFEAHGDQGQVAAMRAMFARFSESEAATYRQMAASPNDMFNRTQRAQNACRNTDAKMFVEGKSNCLNGVDSLPAQRLPGRMPGIGGDSMQHKPRLTDPRFIYPQDVPNRSRIKSPSE